MRWIIARLRALFPDIRSSLWPFYLLLVQCHRAGGQASGITITVLAAAYSIALPFLFPALTQGLTAPRFIEILILLLVGSYLLIVASGGIALRTADPETYARILLAGRPAKEVLFTISKRIDRNCRRTLRRYRWAEEILWELEEKTRCTQQSCRLSKLPPEKWWRRRFARFVRWMSLCIFRVRNAFRAKSLTATSFVTEVEGEGSELISEELRDEIDCLLWWLRQLPRKQYTGLLRTEVMKYRASQELDIPPRRLCDHLFQYSPAMHRDRLAKYVQNWEEILDFRPIGPGVDEQRLRDKVIQNISFINNVLLRRRYQKQILENRDLHPYIVQFASMHSTSGSLHTYAESLRFVAMSGLRNLVETRVRARKREKDRIRDRFAFLCRKQQAHPGFDLHALLLRAIGRMDPKFSGLLSSARSVLDELEISRLPSGGGSEDIPTISEERLESFRYLSFSLACLVADSRAEIFEKFWNVYKAWFDQINVRYIITHGYSRTVLSVLRRCLPSREEAEEEPIEELPRLFFLLPDSKDSFDTRVMEYELKEDPYLDRFRYLAAGSEKHLLGIFESNGPVLVLLGAECFDQDKRVVHPRGIEPVLRALLKDFKDRTIPCLVAVVAESYKCHEDSLTKDTKFYGQHFDRIDLYPPDLIHLILTGEGTYPPDWQRVIQDLRTPVPPPVSPGPALPAILVPPPPPAPPPT